MPNWVKNVVRISGTPEELNKFKEFVAGPHSDFDFNKIIPMPESLKIDSWSSGEDGLALLYFQETDPSKKELINKAYKSRNMFFDDIDITYKDKKDNLKETVDKDDIKLAKTYLDNYIKYGATDWYEWSCDNWGTKWNVDQPELTETTDTIYTYYFDTAWSMPQKIFKTLGEKFPTLDIDGDYADEDLGNNCGSWYYLNGDLYSRDLEEKPQEFAAHVWGYDDYSEAIGEYDELADEEETTEEELEDEGLDKLANNKKKLASKPDCAVVAEKEER